WTIRVSPTPRGGQPSAASTDWRYIGVGFDNLNRVHGWRGILGLPNLKIVHAIGAAVSWRQPSRILVVNGYCKASSGILLTIRGVENQLAADGCCSCRLEHDEYNQRACRCFGQSAGCHGLCPPVGTTVLAGSDGPG